MSTDEVLALITAFAEGEYQVARIKLAVARPVAGRPCRVVFDVIVVFTGPKNGDEIGRVENTIEVRVAEHDLRC